jgi:hypothetical protein
VQAVLDAYPDWSIPARVITTIPAADRQRATVLVRIGFEELDPRILPDMGIKVAFLEAEEEQTAPGRSVSLVPRSALRRVDGRDVVFIINDGRAERRAVSVGSLDDQEAVILSGLLAGERAVIEAPEDLADGDRVSER